MAFTGVLAYVAALQVAGFRRVDRFAYNSTFMTGNLRDVAEGFYDALTPGSTPETREKGLSQARDLGLICLCFLARAILGAWAAPRFLITPFGSPSHSYSPSPSSPSAAICRWLPHLPPKPDNAINPPAARSLTTAFLTPLRHRF
jgi:hypothetical protein